ncbi:MAG: hypothetical protein ACTHMS_15145 [Jatrophihabitans sp.]|uniref:hypothetical protein n=1 Tax=Jatrophihabitans sp. TaxID=1932789 RepID=UPI003F8001B2
MDAQRGVGAAWRALAEQAERDVRSLGVRGEVHAGISPEGWLTLELRPRDKAASATLRDYVARAMEMCETCGGRAVRYSGTTVTVVCEGCRDNGSW